MALKFGKLPLVEVVIRVATEGVIPVDLEFIDFTKSLDWVHSRKLLSQPAQGIGTVVVIPPQGYPRGLELAHSEPGVKVIAQPDLLAVAWRTDQPGGAEYPGFVRLYEILKQSLKDVESQVGNVETRATNMVYTSLVETKEPPSPGLVKSYFQGLIPECSKRGELFHDINVSWQTSSVDFRAQIKRVGRAKAFHGLQLTTTAGTFTDREGLDQAIETNHTSLEDFFPSLLTEKAKKEWEYTNGPNN